MKNNLSKGFVSTVAKFTKSNWIKKVVSPVSKVTDKNCNCGKRQYTLNILFPYYNK